MRHLLRRTTVGTQCTLCLKEWKTKPRKDNCIGLAEYLAHPEYLVQKDYFKQYNAKPASRAIACRIENFKRPPNPNQGKVGTSRRGYRNYYLRCLLYDKRNSIVDDPNFPPILDWENRPKDLYTEYKLPKWNLKPGNAKPKAAIWHWTNQDWVFFYDRADCILLYPDLPTCYDESEVLGGLHTKREWEKLEPNHAIAEDAIPVGCYRYYSRHKGWVTKYIFDRASLIWQPRDRYICRTTLKKAYLLSDSWIKRLGQSDLTTCHSTYKTPIYLYSKQRVEKFLADNAEEYATWLDERDRYLEIFEQNREKILAGAAKAVETRKFNKYVKLAKPIADQFDWDSSKRLVKEQMVKCLKCVSGKVMNRGFLCAIHPTGLDPQTQIPCKDWQQLS